LRSSSEPPAQTRKAGQRQRERVGDVGRRRQRVELEDPPNGVLDLVLGGGAGGGDRALDLGRRERQHRDVALARGQTDHAAGVRHQQGRPGKLVLGVEVLEDEHRRRLCLEEAPDAVVDQMDPRFERQICARRDDAATEHGDPARAGLDQSVAGSDQAGVDAEDLEAMRPRWPREPRQECRS